MNRSIRREYVFSQREVHEALIAWMKSKDLQAPDYVGNTPCTSWIREDESLRVVWIVEDKLDY